MSNWNQWKKFSWICRDGIRILKNTSYLSLEVRTLYGCKCCVVTASVCQVLKFVLILINRQNPNDLIFFIIFFL